MVTLAHTISPLVPEAAVAAPLLERAAALLKESRDLLNHTIGPSLRPILRSMNSYYTNRIEGQHTSPTDIDRALNAGMSNDRRIARLQRLALAHMQVEEQQELEVLDESRTRLFSPEWAQSIHHNLYMALPEDERTTEEGHPLGPGQWRDRPVSLGRHLAPEVENVPGLMEVLHSGYRNLPYGESLLIGIAACHHRMAYIHPFLDGNGRVARLHSHLLLHWMGLTGGVWSIMRGLARNQQDYYRFLNDADLPRKGGSDGRGNLTQAGLVDFVSFFLDICLDQVRFMAKMLQLTEFRNRLRDLLLWMEANPWKLGSEMSVVKIEALEALHYVSLVGRLERAKFLSMTGLSERTARRVLSSLIDFGLLRSESSRAPVEFRVPMGALRFLFPRLWPEAEQDFADYPRVR